MRCMGCGEVSVGEGDMLARRRECKGRLLAGDVSEEKGRFEVDDKQSGDFLISIPWQRSDTGSSTVTACLGPGSLHRFFGGMPLW